MARRKRRDQKPFEVPIMGFKSVMTQMQRKLEAEGQGRDQALVREMAKQFCGIMEEMEQRAPRYSLFYFSWRVFERVSNHFWPGSVLPEDKPSTIQEHSKPFICVHKFRGLDTSTIPFAQLVDFIQCNGAGPFPWPKKSRKQKRLEREARKYQDWYRRLNLPGGNESNPIVISPERRALPRHPMTFTIPKITNSSVSLRPPLEERRLTSTIRYPIPNLSVVCQPGWDLNKSVRILAAEIKPDENIMPSRITSTQTLSPVEPSLGTVSFRKVPEKEVEAFLSRFLGREV